MRIRVKINSEDCKKIKAQEQKLMGISFYCMPLSLEDATDAYTEMRLIVEKEAHLQGKPIHCFLNSCASPEENISMFFSDKLGTKMGMNAVNS